MGEVEKGKRKKIRIESERNEFSNNLSGKNSSLRPMRDDPLRNPKSQRSDWPVSYETPDQSSLDPFSSVPFPLLRVPWRTQPQTAAHLAFRRISFIQFSRKRMRGERGIEMRDGGGRELLAREDEREEGDATEGHVTKK